MMPPVIQNNLTDFSIHEIISKTVQNINADIDRLIIEGISLLKIPLTDVEICLQNDYINDGTTSVDRYMIRQKSNSSVLFNVYVENHYDLLHHMIYIEVRSDAEESQKNHTV